MPRGGKALGGHGRTRNNKQKSSGLGRALVKDRFGKRGGLKQDVTSAADLIHVEDEPEVDNLVSITESNDLAAFLEHAELAGTDFTAEKGQVTVVTTDQLNFSLRASSKEAQEEFADQLVIPHRPAWTREMTKQELDRNEKTAFLEWRRGLAMLEANDNLIITPCEKNINVWRQLWRVVERSDIVVQIVDARNPLLFRCADLESYVRKVDPTKRNLLLVNKADYLPVAFRKAWASYFQAHGIEYLFWSAYSAQVLIDEELAATKAADAAAWERQLNRSSDDEDEDDEDEDEDEDEDGLPSSATVNESKKDDEDTDVHVLTREELLAFFEKLVGEKKRTDDDDDTRNSYVIGMVGYPNVGKSSTINALYGEKKVTVSATPGKTKHFQTLILSPSITLCDCPGLVFPSFVSTRAEMVCNGILPIDQLRDHRGPVTLVAERIPRVVLEASYGITLPEPVAEDEVDANRPPTAEEFLSSYAYIRGYMTQRGLPDEARAARYVLKDYITGRLLYCFGPPGTKIGKAVAVLEDGTALPVDELDEALVIPVSKEMEKTAEKRRKTRGGKATFDTSNYDPNQEFFEQQNRVAMVTTNGQGRQIVSGKKRVQKAHDKAMRRQAEADAKKKAKRAARKGKGAA